MSSPLGMDGHAALAGANRWRHEQVMTVSAADSEAGVAALSASEPRVVILDLEGSRGIDGADASLPLLREIRTTRPDARVVVVMDRDNRELARAAFSMGAHDVLQRPLDPDLLNTIVERILYRSDLEADSHRFSDRPRQTLLEGVLVGGPEMARVCDVAARVATTGTTITLQGESGTGKELLARAIHRLSRNADGRFVTVNCAAIAGNLLESQLFGQDSGTLADGARRTRGRIDLAHNGTLFLDEVGDLPLNLQARLLQFLQEGVIEPAGGRTGIRVDTRVLCATQRDLQGMIAQGTFREDLYYRLSEITLTIPPLRDRRADIFLLARQFVERNAAELGCLPKAFSRKALGAMEQHAWPGNVRELESRVRRALLLSDGAEITDQDLELTGPREPGERFNLRRVRRVAEERTVRKALAYCEGNISRAAGLLGVSRPSLYDLMRRLGVS
jgi:two-component system, NtrC family, response regulator